MRLQGSGKNHMELVNGTVWKLISGRDDQLKLKLSVRKVMYLVCGYSQLAIGCDEHVNVLSKLGPKGREQLKQHVKKRGICCSYVSFTQCSLKTVLRAFSLFSRRDQVFE